MKKLLNSPWFLPLMTAFAGIILRLMFLLPGWLKNDPAVFERPDSEFYMRAAYSLAENNGYPGSIRAPGFSAAAAILLKCTGSVWSIPLFMAVAGGAGAILIYLAGKEYADRKTGLLAETLYALNLTAAVNAPMLLSDTLFGIFAALQLWLFILFWKRNKLQYACCSAAVAALGALIRPINMLWFMPLAVIILLNSGISFRRRLLTAGLSVMIFCGILAPWMTRNAMRGAGFCIDVNTGAMLHQNGAMLLAEVNHSDFEMEKAKILSRLDKLFADKQRFPDEKSVVDYRKREYIKLIKKYPFTWLKQQFQWKILLPDAPTGFELLGVTSPGRGTMGVLAKHGVFAAINHYFDGRIFLPVLFLPFLLICGATLAGCVIHLLRLAAKLRTGYFELIIFLAFAEYYLFLPGAITAPRYQIPALPVITVMAAAGLLWCYRKYKSEK